MSYDKLLDQFEDGVDPRVQVELEKLNSSTDEINKLEVDLDEARSHFRQLLQESTSQIEGCAKKLGNCIVKVRPYYDARIQAKEALQETQKAAANFERANSAHAAAKEMVYLAEEGLKAEGRTFDHAWQEMLNHATMRVNESESERTRCEAEHKKTSQHYQITETRVRLLQKELKRAITKSRPYFELKIYYNQLLEKQKGKVKNLEKQVADVKLTYAHTLKNLEQISDEIHKSRQKNKENSNVDSGRLNQIESQSNFYNGTHGTTLSVGAKTPQCFRGDLSSLGDNDVLGAEFDNSVWNHEASKILSPISETLSSNQTYTSNTRVSSQPDTDTWSECSDGNLEGSPNSGNDSSLTGPADSELEEDTFKFPEKFNCNGAINCVGNDSEIITGGNTKSKSKSIDPFFPQLKAKSDKNFDSSFEGVGICSFPVETELNLNFSDKNSKNDFSDHNETPTWTEIKLHSPEEEIFTTVKFVNGRRSKNELEEDFDIPYSPLSEVFYKGVSESKSGEDNLKDKDQGEKMTQEIICNQTNVKEPKTEGSQLEESSARSLKGTPKKHNIRRQSLDVLWNSSAGEKFKEILSQSIMKLNISSLTEKKLDDSKLGRELCENENSAIELKGNETEYDSKLASQFGMHIFNRKSYKLEEDIRNSVSEKKKVKNQESLPSHIGNFISGKEKLFTRKAPSPLEKTANYLNTDEESNSDSESLPWSDMLTDEQLSSLILDRDLSEIYQDII